MKASLKKILFIIVCAELMILYWTFLEVRQTEQVVYRHDDSLIRKIPSSDTANFVANKAS